MITLDPITRRRLARFRSMRRGWWSLVALVVLTAVAALGPLLIGSRPLVLSHDGELRFPALADSLRARAMPSHPRRSIHSISEWRVSRLPPRRQAIYPRW